MIATGFQRQERFLPNKSQGPLETVRKYLSIPARESSGESFVTVYFFYFLFFFSCCTQNGTGLLGEGSGIGGQDRVGSPCVNQEILGPTCHIQLHPCLQPHNGYLWQVGWLEWATLILLNHCEGRLGAWPWGSFVPRTESCQTSQMMAYVASSFRKLVMVWALFSPMSSLSTD